MTEIRGVIQSGAIGSADSSKLAQFSAWLCDPAIPGNFNGADYQQVCETVRLQMLRSMIEGFEERGKTMQRLVVALAVAALVTSVVQTVVAIRAEVRATQEATPRASILDQQSHALAPSPSPRSSASVASK